MYVTPLATALVGPDVSADESLWPPRLSGLLERRCSIRRVGDDSEGSRQTAEAGSWRDSSVASWLQV